MPIRRTATVCETQVQLHAVGRPCRGRIVAITVSLAYGRSAFLAALGTPHNRVNDEHATPLFKHLYANGYLGMAHLLRVREQDRDSPDPGALHGRQEMLIGDQFLDVR